MSQASISVARNSQVQWSVVCQEVQLLHAIWHLAEMRVHNHAAQKSMVVQHSVTMWCS